MGREHFASRPAREERCPRCRAATLVGRVDGLEERVERLKVNRGFMRDHWGRLVEVSVYVIHVCPPEDLWSLSGASRAHIVPIGTAA